MTHKTEEQINREVAIYRDEIAKLDKRLEFIEEQADRCRASQRSYMARILMCEQERTALAGEGSQVAASSPNPSVAGQAEGGQR